MAMAQRLAQAGNATLGQNLKDIVANLAADGSSSDYNAFQLRCDAIVPDPAKFSESFQKNLETICPEMMRLFTQAFVQP